MSDNPEVSTTPNPEIHNPISIKRSEVDLAAIQEQLRQMPIRRASTIISTLREMRNHPAEYFNLLDLLLRKYLQIVILNRFSKMVVIFI